MAAVALDQMDEGEEGIITANPCASRHGARLAELGLTEGNAVTLVRRGSPMVLQIGPARFCVRAEDTADIAVLCA
ncbi:MAG: ferrous iron transport protein A [Deltaproteobacteria bacterium]|nr:ferrous iron transport protein A [Deltaproteobacteria bacterium]